MADATTKHGDKKIANSAGDGGELNLVVRIVRGSLVNTLGTIAKGIYPLFLIVITRLYGPELVGSYWLAYTIMDVTLMATVWGFQDGVLLVAARDLEGRESEQRMYNAMANALLIVGGISALVIAFSRFGGPLLLTRYFGQAGLVETVQVMAQALPLVALPVLVVAATKARLTMVYDALLLGFLRPALLLGFSVSFWWLAPGLGGLAWAYVATHMVLSVLAVVVFARHFSGRKLLSALLHVRPDRKLTAFAIPQNLNMTFSYFVTGLDVLMLGAFSVRPELIAFYATGAEITRNVRVVRLSFANTFAPVIARLWARGERVQLEEMFNRISRWVISIALPVILLIALFKDRLLLLFHESYTESSAFMVLLLIVPLANSTVGLANNIIVMSGKSRLNLLNSISVALLNAGFNWLLIPRYGLIGAAGASALAAVIFNGMALMEVRWLLGIRLRFGQIYKPVVAGVAAAFATAAVWLILGTGGWLNDVLGAILALGVYVCVYVAMKPERQDVELFLPFIGRNRKPVAAALKEHG